MRADATSGGPEPRVLRRSAQDAVLVKPAGMSSEAPGGAREARVRGGAPTLIEWARMRLEWPDAELPHRLDRPTRGLVVVARDRAAVAAHNAAIRAGRWRKIYLARVRVGPERDPAALLGPHRAYLRREGRTARLVRSGGDPARLEVLAMAPSPARRGEHHLVIRLETGRYHQIRAMLAGLGAPLVGDADYGGAPGPFYLEHAVLEYPAPDTDLPARIYDPADPEREPLDAALAAALAAAAEGTARSSDGPDSPAPPAAPPRT